MNGSEPWSSRGADPPDAGLHGWPELGSSAGRPRTDDGLRFAHAGYLSGPPGALQQPPPPPFPHHPHSQQQLRRELSFEPPGSDFGAFQQQQQPTHLQHHNHIQHLQQPQAYPPHLQSRANGSESVFGGPSSGAFSLGRPLPGASSGLLSSSPLENGTPLHGHFGMSGPPPLPPPPPPPLGMGGMGPMDLGLGGPSSLSGSSSQQHLGASAPGFPSLLPPPGSADHHLGNSQVFYHLQFQQQRHLQQQQQQQQQQHEANGFGSLQQPGLGSARFARQPPQQQAPPPLPQFDLSQSMLQMNLNSSPDAPTSRLSEPSPLASLASSSSSDPFAAWASPASSSSAVASSSSVASAASLRDQMNQQMAALYQHDQSQSSALSDQHEPLAPSGSALLSLLNSGSSSSSTGASGRDFGDAHAFPDLPDLSSIDLLGTTPSPSMMLRMPLPQQQQQQAPPPHLVANSGYPSNQSHHRLIRRSPPPQSSHVGYSALGARSGDPAFGSKSRSDKDTSSSSSDVASSIEVSPDVTKPNGNIKVQVSLLADECAPGRVLMVGLFRNGQLTNERPIFVKQVLFENKLNRNYRFLNTRITFRAPRSPGEFAFRVFESRRPTATGPSASSSAHQHSPDDRDAPAAVYSNVTIARSNTLKVTMEYAHFIETLRTTHDRFRSGIASGDPSVVLSSLLSLLRLVDLVETVFLHGNVLLTEFVDACVQLVSLRPARVAALFTPTDACPNPIESFHGTMRNVFNSIEANACVKELIADDVLRTVDRFQRALYCQASGYYFQTTDDRAAYWETHFGFAPVVLRRNDDDGDDDDEAQQQQRDALLASPFVAASVSDWVQREAQRLIPDRDAFRRARQAIYDTVHSHVVARLPIPADLDVFGSSANDFGTHESDMDMCLVLETPAMTADEKQQVLKLVVALLERQPHVFRDIDASRLTARIPIVMFTLVDTGVECDLSVENVLAQRNTAILRAYANADPRVRVLAYVLKRFVKRRRMNAPFEGTLSSYGYLLMLIHFLQRQDPPVLPVLQSLPPTWDGARSCACSPTRVACSRESPHCALRERHVAMGLPSVLCRGPADDGDGSSHASSRSASVETYFYDPFAFADPAPKLALLAAFGARNTASVGALLVGFFEYFGVRFDASRDVVSVRMARTLSKDEKKRANQWRMHTRVSIEDPFEVAYDVAHVLKGSRDKYIRQQFARAHALLMRGAIDALASDRTSDAERVDAIMAALMDEVHDPPFLQSSSNSGSAAASALAADDSSSGSGAANGDVDASA